MVNKYNLKYLALNNEQVKQKIQNQKILDYYLRKYKEKKNDIDIAKQRKLKHNFNI